MKHLRKFLTTLLLLCTAVVAAHDFEVDGIYYNILSEEDKTVEVTYYGSNYNYQTNEYTGHVIIPEKITYNNTTYIVASIKEYTFSMCEQVTGVTIPSTIKSIGTAAFSVNQAGGVDFSDVYITDLAAWCSIDFANNASNPLCFAENFYLNGNLITDIVLPEGVEDIKDYAFYNFYGESVSIPSSVKTIGTDAFYNGAIKNVYISDLAAWCNIDFNSNPLNNAESLYLDGDLITDLIIPEGVTEIKALAFNGCGSIESLSISQSTTSIANNAFANCSNIVKITVAEGNTTYDSRENCNAIIETATKRLILGCENSTIPNSVEIIGSRAFLGCGTSQMEIPNSITTIEEYAFYNCTSLKSIAIPNSVVSIGNNVFSHCSCLESVIISNSIKTVEPNTFYYCTSLTNVTIPEGVTSIGSKAFSYCNTLNSITIPSSITKIDYEAFSGCSNLKLVYNNSSLNIKFDTNNGYVGCYANSIISPSDDIQGDYIFRTTNGIHTLIAYTGNDKDLILPENYKGEKYAINERVFRENSNINSVIISDGVTNIGTYSFKGCYNLAKITIGKNVANIEDYAFSGCSGLKCVINNSSLNITAGASSYGNVAYYATAVILGTDDIQGDFIFRTTNDVYSLIAYTGNEKELTLPENYKGENYIVGDGAFKNKDVRRITIPESVTSIGNNAFYGCGNLRVIYNNSTLNIVLGSTTHGYVAYYAKAVIAKGDNIQGDYVFRIIDDNPTLVGYLGDETEIVLSSEYYDGVYAIGVSLFKNNKTLKSISFPDNITSIGEYAFYGCTGLTSITIPNNVTNIENYAFNDCSNLCTVFNLSTLALTKGSTTNGYVAYYAQKVVNAPNGSIEGDYVFGVIDGINTLLHCNSVSSSFEDWTSTNKSNSSSSSKTYTIIAKAGDILTFDWMVSSERNYDIFTVTINGTEILERSGEETGNYQYTFTEDGKYTLIARYSKDDDGKDGSNCGKIYNIIFSGANTVDIVLPEDYKGGNYVIGSEVFKNTNLKNITIPATVTGIGENAFNGCTILSSITSNIAAEDLFVPGTGAFTGVDKAKCTLYIPRKSKSIYTSTDGWKDFENIKEMIISNINITINEYGSATYCSEFALDFSNVEGLKAYAATGYNTATQVVTLTRIMTAKETTGLFLMGAPGEYMVPVLEYSNDFTLNLLVGTLEPTGVNSTTDDGNYINFKYTIGETSDAPLFYQFEDNSTLSAGKAYLQLPATLFPVAASKSVGVRFDDGTTTDIKEVENAEDETQTVYDLQGRKVENPVKGIYIINGKKVLVR